ncbi:hypothetical protein EJB05_00532, partial [Eragrostis curvula]
MPEQDRAAAASSFAGQIEIAMETFAASSAGQSSGRRRCRFRPRHERTPLSGDHSGIEASHIENIAETLKLEVRKDVILPATDLCIIQVCFMYILML